jgi:hypothetical protein
MATSIGGPTDMMATSIGGPTAPPSSIGTSNVAKYQLGQAVSNLGPDKLTGVITVIVPATTGAISGPGEIFIKPSSEVGATLSIESELHDRMSFRKLTNCILHSRQTRDKDIRVQKRPQLQGSLRELYCRITVTELSTGANDAGHGDEAGKRRRSAGVRLR